MTIARKLRCAVLLGAVSGCTAPSGATSESSNSAEVAHQTAALSEQASGTAQAATNGGGPVATPAEERKARQEAGQAPDAQSAARRRDAARAAVLGQRAALATQREVLQAMKKADGDATGKAASGQAAAHIARLEQRIAEREAKLSTLEDEAR